MTRCSTQIVPDMPPRAIGKGHFVVVDGLDGIGKGVIERALDEYEQKLGRSTFDTISFSKAHAKGLPELIDFWDPPRVHYHTVITAEPTYAGVGHTIRNELISKNGRNYAAQTLIPAYGIDREILLKRVVGPALENGLNVLQGRCVASTLAYQGYARGLKPQELPAFAKEISAYEGNRLELNEMRPDLLILPVIKDLADLIKRIRARTDIGKDDNSIFDNLEFQGKIKPFYESDEMRGLFEKSGTKVEYLDASISREHTANEAVRIYKGYLDSRK